MPLMVEAMPPEPELAPPTSESIWSERPAGACSFRKPTIVSTAVRWDSGTARCGPRLSRWRRGLHIHVDQLERCLRDIRAASQHVTVMTTNYEVAGQFFFGADVSRTVWSPDSKRTN